MAALLCAARVAVVGLSDPSEGRYAEIAREMARSGDWIVPRWQGVAHLEKPPLAYWSAAAGIRLFGEREFAVRLGALLAFLATAVLTAGIARRVAGPRAALPAAGGLLLTPYALAVGPACLTDPFLLLATTLFHHSVLRRIEDGTRSAMTWAVVALGVGFLAKGHTVLLFTVVPLAVARVGVFRELWTPRRLGLLVLLVAPWFVAVETRFPGFLAEQVLRLGSFLGSGEHYHRAPFFIYAVVLGFGLLPVTLYACRGVWMVEGRSRRLLLSWLLLPFVVLTLVRSRTWTYALPLVPPLVVLGATGLLAHRPSSWTRVAASVAAAALAVASVVAMRWIPSASLPWIAGGRAAAAAWLLALRRAGPVLVSLGVAAILSAGLVAAGVADEGIFKVHRSLARETARLASEGRPILLIATNAPSLAFYLPQSVTLVGGPSRLREEAERWGESPAYRPHADVGAILREDTNSVILVHEEIRDRYAPDRKARAQVRKMLLLDDLAR